MKKYVISLLGLFWLGASLLSAQEDEKPLFYPFTVTLGGQKAAVKEKNDLFAVVPDPVKPDAVLVLDAISDNLIVNAFRCNEDGSVFLDKQPAAIIFAQKSQEVKLNATMDKKPLPPGTYLMNVVAHNATSRVLFQVSDREKKLKMPDLSKIVNFLKGKK